MTYGACGFNNNGISVYSSATLSNTGWKLETLNALPAATRAVGEYWEPNIVYNPTTSKYVMWWIYSKPNTTLGVVQVGVADAVGGPWTIANANVSLSYPSFTSAEIFVDSAARTSTSTKKGEEGDAMDAEAEAEAGVDAYE